MLYYLPVQVTIDNYTLFGIPQGEENGYINQWVLYDDGQQSGFPEAFVRNGIPLQFSTQSLAQSFIDAQTA